MCSWSPLPMYQHRARCSRSARPNAVGATYLFVAPLRCSRNGRASGSRAGRPTLTYPVVSARSIRRHDLFTTHYPNRDMSSVRLNEQQPCDATTTLSPRPLPRTGAGAVAGRHLRVMTETSGTVTTSFITDDYGTAHLPPLGKPVCDWARSAHLCKDGTRPGRGRRSRDCGAGVSACSALLQGTREDAPAISDGWVFIPRDFWGRLIAAGSMMFTGGWKKDMLKVGGENGRGAGDRALSGAARRGGLLCFRCRGRPGPAPDGGAGGLCAG